MILLALITISGQVISKDISQAYKISLHELKDENNNLLSIVNMEGIIEVSSVYGMPVIICSAKWSFANNRSPITINSKGITDIPEEILRQAILEDIKLGFSLPSLEQSSDQHEISCDPRIMDATSSDNAITTSSVNPSWNSIFYLRDNYETKNNEPDTYVDEATAKKIMAGLLKNGFNELNSSNDNVRVLTANINLEPVRHWVEQHEKTITPQQQQTKEEKEPVQQPKQEESHSLAARDHFNNKNYQSALDSIEKAESLLGTSNAELQGTRVKVLYETGQYQAVKKAFEAFNTYSPKQNLKQEIEAYLSRANEKMEQQRLAAEKIVEKEAVERALREQKALELEKKVQEFREKNPQFVADLASMMVPVPAGQFRMGDIGGTGDDDEKPVRMVDIDRFLLSVQEITFDQWRTCVEAGGCTYMPEDHNWGKGRRPVINVSYYDITQEFIPWLNSVTGRRYRLPTEVEWEYAARAGSESNYSWGDSIGGGQANCDGCGSRWDNRKTAPVKSFQANPYGLYDMHGNVWEWTADCWSSRYPETSTMTNKSTTEDCRTVIRGGSWYSKPNSLRSANRDENNRSTRQSHLGFRLVQD